MCYSFPRKKVHAFSPGHQAGPVSRVTPVLLAWDWFKRWTRDLCPRAPMPWPSLIYYEVRRKNFLFLLHYGDGVQICLWLGFLQIEKLQDYRWKRTELKDWGREGQNPDGLGQSHSSQTGLIMKQINARIFLFWMTSKSWHPQGFVPNHFLIFIYIHSLGDLIRFHGFEYNLCWHCHFQL